MKYGIIKKIIVLIICLASAVSLYGEIGDHSSECGMYKYVSLGKVDIKAVCEYMDIFFDNYYFSFKELYYSRDGSYIKNFFRHFYFQKCYQLEQQTYVTIEIHYQVPLFSFQKEYNVKIEFRFICFPPYERNIEDWPDYEFILTSFMDSFDEYILRNNIGLTKTDEKLSAWIYL
jgi:hypothetical protein